MLALMNLHMANLFFALTTDSIVQGTPIEKSESGLNRDYDAAVKFFDEIDAMKKKMKNKAIIADWNYETNLTEENRNLMFEVQAEVAKFTQETEKNASSFAWKEFKGRNKTVYEWFKEVGSTGPEDLSDDEYITIGSVVADMEEVHFTAKVCPKDNPENKPCELSLNPDLTDILSESTDYEELQYYWTEWRKVTNKVRPEFMKYVKISNEVAVLLGFKDSGEWWRSSYKSDTFVNDMEELWKTLEPFYQQLHAYVRRQLIDQYPEWGILPNGPIPAHLLGHMWAQTWQSMNDIVKPFPDKKSADVTERMVKKNMTVLDMFKLSEEFFTSLGLEAMTPEFWNRSIIEKPSDREMVCRASAWDFSDGKDFRIMMCARVNFADFSTIHHEMGHIQYFQQYAHLPEIFQDGANPGFHEAIGDTLALSATTPNHLIKIGLLDEQDSDEETEINQLMETALQKVVFLPSAYLIDAYRWKIFSGEISEDELNLKWWELRLKYQGLCPPVRRTEKDFDAASKYHVIADFPFIRYFVSYIIQFQFHKALCEAANHTGPLYQCDIYQSKEAGRLLSETMRLGCSVHWSEAMKIITRGKTDKIDAQPLMEYFEPLIKWLQKQNEGETVGWKSTDPMACPESNDV